MQCKKLPTQVLENVHTKKDSWHLKTGHAFQINVCGIYKKFINVKKCLRNLRKMFHTICKMFVKFLEKVHVLQKYVLNISKNAYTMSNNVHVIEKRYN